jgi:hypothetical protein
MKLGLLMEAAQAQQKVAETSLRRLKAISSELATVVRDEVHRALVEELSSLTQDAQRATDALHAVGRAAAVRALVWSIGLSTLCSIVPLSLACWIVPSPSEIESLRAKRDELASHIAQLQQQGGGVDLRHCGKGSRLCVRVDRKAPTYGEHSDYLIVGGY